jgi:Putative MetA-pathway of phenol degradation
MVADWSRRTPRLREYEPRRALNPSANRWTLRPTVNFSYTPDRGWTWLETYVSGAAFTPNDAFQAGGASRLTQRPLFIVEGHARLLRFIPARGNVPKFDRAWIATVLTAQVAVGAALGIAAQAFLVVGIIGYVMPWFGLGLLDMARDVATFNLPARVGQLFGGIL